MGMYLSAANVAEIMDCSENHAYKVIRDLNAELKRRGYITRSGRVPAAYFYERAGLWAGSNRKQEENDEF